MAGLIAHVFLVEVGCSWRLGIKKEALVAWRRGCRRTGSIYRNVAEEGFALLRHTFDKVGSLPPIDIRAVVFRSMAVMNNPAVLVQGIVELAVGIALGGAVPLIPARRNEEDIVFLGVAVQYFPTSILR